VSVVERPRYGSARSARSAGPSGSRRLQPALVWAGIGAVILAVETFAIGRWIVSGEATRTPAGPDPVPGWMSVAAHTVEVVCWALSAWILWRFLIKPWRRDRRITFDGIVILVCATLFWLDPLYQYTRPWSNYNAVFFNLGSWAHLPGAPNDYAHLFPEPLIFASSLYIAMVFGGMAVAGAFMGALQRRHPQLPRWAVAGAALLFLFVVDVVLEGLVFVRLGLYVFPGAHGPMLFEGRYYQFPFDYSIGVTVTWWAWSCIRHFRDDQGRTFVERGTRRTGVRFLALAGVLHLSGLLLFVLPMNLRGLGAAPWPDDFRHRSYLWAGLCSGPDVPCPFDGYDR
jgi:hypothetical protein